MELKFPQVSYIQIRYIVWVRVFKDVEKWRYNVQVRELKPSVYRTITMFEYEYYRSWNLTIQRMPHHT